MSNKIITFNEKQLNVIQKTVAKWATKEELSMFIAIAKKYNLDPFTKEIWFIKRAKKYQNQYWNWDYKRLENWEIDYSWAETIIMASRDWYLKIAQKDANFEGMRSAVIREWDDIEIDFWENKIKHIAKFTPNKKIIWAWAIVTAKWKEPVLEFANFSEYNTWKSTWNNYPSAMIKKVAEVMALKRQFWINWIVWEWEINIEDNIKIEEAEEVKEVKKLPNMFDKIKACQTVKELQEFGNDARENSQIFEAYSEKMLELNTDIQIWETQEEAEKVEKEKPKTKRKTATKKVAKTKEETKKTSKKKEEKVENKKLAEALENL